MQHRSSWLLDHSIARLAPRLTVALFVLLLLTIASLQNNTLMAQNSSPIAVGCNTAELIHAIEIAQTIPSETTLRLATGCTYTLTDSNNADTSGEADDSGTNGLPSINTPLIIEGNNATIERSTAGGTAAFRFFRVTVDGSLTLRDLTLRNGMLQTANAHGGAIHNRGILVLDTVMLGTHRADEGYGGAIYSAVGSKTEIAKSTIGTETEPCRAGSAGGAISNNGDMRLSHTVVQYNYSTKLGAIDIWPRGGGIANYGTMHMEHTTIYHNSVGDTDSVEGLLIAGGGGVYNGMNATLVITSSSIHENSAYGWFTIGGGGIYNAGDASVVINNSTLSGNTASSTSAGFQNCNGGAIYSSSNGKVALYSSTIAKNTARKSGGGIFNESSDSRHFHVENSIIAHNILSASGDAVDISGVFDSAGYNLIGIGDGGNGFTHDGDIVGSSASPRDARLDELANNGGNTLTYALLADSPAIDAGNLAGCRNYLGLPLSTDQRGVNRLYGSACDIGAFETVVLVEPIIVDQVVEITPSDAQPYDSFGSSVAVSRDTVVIGAEGRTIAGTFNVGTGYIFGYDNASNTWYQQAHVGFAPGDEQAHAYFGKSVAVHQGKVAVGSILHLGHGSTFLYERDHGGANAWGQVGFVTPTEGAYGSDFGSSLALYDNMVAIGAPGAKLNNVACGSVYLFEYDGNTWNKIAQVFPSDCQPEGKFGLSVALHDDILVVGAFGGTYLEPQIGAAFVFVRQPDDTWRHVAKLEPSDGELRDAFGHAVAVYEDTIIVGAYGVGDGDEYMAGAAYVFTSTNDDATSWVEVVKLQADERSREAYFGWSVAIHDDLAVIGSHRAWVDDIACGAAYVFERHRGGVQAWGQALKLENPACSDGDYFGRNVAVDSEAVIVSAEWSNEHGTNAGGAYIYPRVTADSKPMVFDSETMAYQDRPLLFTAEEFDQSFNDPHSGYPLQSVAIQTVPAHGMLSLHGIPLTAGATLAIDDLDSLVYMPDGGYSGSDSFIWTGRSQAHAARNTATVDITVVPNHIPSIAHIYRSGTKNRPTNLRLAHFRHVFVDKESTQVFDEETEQQLSFITIVSLPDQGTLMFNGQTLVAGDVVSVADMEAMNKDIVFVPPTDWIGTTTFAWNGSDGFDYASDDALVSLTFFPQTTRRNHAGVVIEQPDSSYTTYCVDLDNIHLDGPEEWKNGIRLLQQTGTHIGLQTPSETNVCRVGGLGCSSDNCWCHDPYIWRDWLLNDDDMWRRPAFYETAYERAVQSGNVEWWTWSNNDTAEPPIIFFEQICPNENIPPLVSTLSKYTAMNVVVDFAQQDFVAAFNDQDGDSLTAIQVTSLPNNATLTLAGAPVVVGTEIAASDLDTLTLTPADGWTGTTSFVWNGRDNETYADHDAIVLISVHRPDDPLILSVVVKHGLQDTPLTLHRDDFTEHFFDSGGASMRRLTIRSLPPFGTLSYNGTALRSANIPYNIDRDTMETLVFTPDAAWYGITSFSWNASNGIHSAKSDAQVVLNIQQKMSYTNHNGLVLDYGDGRVETFCIDRDVADALPSDGGSGNGDGLVTGKEIALASGRSTVQGFSGGTVCMIEDTGCPDSDDCWCSCRTLGAHCVYWSYWHLNARGDDWNYSELGWANYSVRNPGDVEGWRWGQGNFSDAVTPPATPFADLCVTMPTLANTTVFTHATSQLPVSRDGFVRGFQDYDGNSLVRVKIITLPDSEHGTLMLNNTAVVAGQIIPFYDLDKLIFVPTDGWDGTASFEWNGSDGASFANYPATLTITTHNTPPTLSNVHKSGLVNTPIAFDQRAFVYAFHDTNDSRVQHIIITSLPQSGTLSFGGTAVARGQAVPYDALNQLVYTPLSDVLGPDSFGWNGSDGISLASQEARVLVTIYDVGPTATERSEASKDATYWLGSLQKDDGGYGAPGLTIDTIFSVVAAGGDIETWRNEECQTMIDSLETEAQSYAEKNPASAGKLILGLVAAGVEDINDFGGVDLLATLQDSYDSATGSFGTMQPDGSVKSSNWDQAFAILALRALDQPIPDQAIAHLLSRTQPDGSWCFYPPGEWAFACVDSTGLVLQALAAANVSADSDVVSKAVAYLHDAQNDDGGFPDLPAGWTGMPESNANSTALVVNALFAMGEDPLGLSWTKWTPKPVNPVSFLMTLQQTDGSLSWKAEVAGDQLIATHQSVPAMLGKPFPIEPTSQASTISNDRCVTGASPTPTISLVSPISTTATVATPTQTLAPIHQETAIAHSTATLATPTQTLAPIHQETATTHSTAVIPSPAAPENVTQTPTQTVLLPTPSMVVTTTTTKPISPVPSTAVTVVPIAPTVSVPLTPSVVVSPTISVPPQPSPATEASPTPSARPTVQLYIPMFLNAGN